MSMRGKTLRRLFAIVAISVLSLVAGACNLEMEQERLAKKVGDLTLRTVVRLAASVERNTTESSNQPNRLTLVDSADQVAATTLQNPLVRKGRLQPDALIVDPDPLSPSPPPRCPKAESEGELSTAALVSLLKKIDCVRCAARQALAG